eukprot:21389_1
MTSNPSRFANVIPNMKRDDHEVWVLCCAWHSERCGEQGYLSECLGFAHAGITAEGDNRVLYQKVAKELLSRLKSGKHKFGAINKGNIDWNCAVFLMDLASTMQQKMNEDQDKVQMCAESYILVDFLRLLYLVNLYAADV